MDVDEDLLYRFEAGLDPQDVENSPIPATILGFGEISAIFQIGENREVAFKRMPLFSELSSAEAYVQRFEEYCVLLTRAGLTLPGHKASIVKVPDRPVVCYIAQERFPSERFAHRLVHRLSKEKTLGLLEQIFSEISKVFTFNRSGDLSTTAAIDGQISNWVEHGRVLLYIDTSTPLYRKGGVEQLDPELFLKSAPPALRWIIRLLFLRDVMNRYYDEREVYIDLAANLYKEQRPGLIPDVVRIINRHLSQGFEPVTTADAEKYYKKDKLIWSLFLAFRKTDRWVKTRLIGKRYDFILPGKISR